MQTRFDVVVIGSCNVDLISYVERFPKAGETICGSKFSMGCGGKGANQCVMAAKLGANSAMIGCIGDDNFGDLFKKNFHSLNINTDNLHVIKDMSTGVAPISVNKEGENSIVIVKGANECLTADHLQQASMVIQNSGVVLCQLEIDTDISLTGLKLARKNNVTTIFNPAPAVENLPKDFLTNTTILCCNETEAEILTGLTVSNLEGAEQALKQLTQMGPTYVVLTLGANGAMFSCQDDTVVQHVAAPKIEKVADTTGAGDCFVGTLAYLMSRKSELSFAEKVRRSVHIAAVSVTKPGTQSSYPTMNELPIELQC